MNTISNDFPDTVDDIFSALLIAGAVVSVRRGTLAIKVRSSSRLPTNVGRAAARSKMALTVHAASVCERCGADQNVEHAIGYALTWCSSCDVTVATARTPGRSMGLFTDYLERSSCKTCPRVGETHNGWCLWCVAKREGVDWDARLAEVEPERFEAARESPTPPSTQPRASSGPTQSSLFR